MPSNFWDDDAVPVAAPGGAAKGGFWDDDAQPVAAAPTAESSISPITTYLQSLGQKLTGDFAGDIAAARRTAMDTAFGDAKLKDFGANFDKQRGAVDDFYAASEEANPKAAFQGGMTADLLTAAVPVGQAAKGVMTGLSAAKPLLAGATLAGAQQFGMSDEETLAGRAKDAGDAFGISGGLSAVGGAVLPPLGRAAGRGLDKVQELGQGLLGKAKAPVDAVRDKAGGLYDLAKTASQGAKEGIQTPGGVVDDLNLPQWSMGPAINKVKKGAQGAFDAVKDQGARAKEFGGLVERLKPKDSPLSNDEFMLSKLLEDGPNEVKDFIAGKASGLLPGQIDEATYKGLLERSVGDRAAARAFNKFDEGEVVAGELEGAYRSTERATNALAQRLKAQARAEFKPVGDEPLRDMLELYEKSLGKNATKGAAPVLEDAYRALDGLDGMAPAQQFDALQGVRESIDRQINFTGRNAGPESEKVLMEARKKLNTYLQAYDAKKESDAVYSTFFRLRDDLFKPVAKVEKGKIVGFDETKVEKVFDNTVTGRKLWKQVMQAKEVVNSGRLAQEESQALKQAIENLERLKDTSNLKKMSDQFRQRQGPSSPAIERQAAAMGKNSALKDAVQAPAGFLNAVDQFFPAQAQQKFGKQVGELSDTERTALVRFWTWSKNNQDASPEVSERVWQAMTQKQ